MHLYNKFIGILTAQERRQLPWLLILIFIGMIFETLGIGLVIPVLALMTQPDFLARYPLLQPLLQSLGEPTQAQLVIGGMLVLVGLYVLKTCFLVFMLWKQNKFTFDLQAALSSRLFSGYLHQPWSFHLQRNSAQLILNATTEVNLFTNIALQSAITLVTEGLVLLGIVSLLLVVEPIGACIVVSTLGLASWVFQKSVKNYSFMLGKGRQYHEGMRIQHIQQGLGGAKDVKLFGREFDFLTQYNMHSEGSAHASRRQKTLFDLPRLWLELLGVAGLVMLVLVMLAQGAALDSLLPVLGLFAVAAFRIIPSANRILGALQNLRFSLPVVNTLYDEVQLLDNTVLPHLGADVPFEKNITIQHVSYRYQHAERHALSDVTLTIQRGTSVGFIGTSGAGKSTLVDVVLGLLTPANGYVKVDGVDIQSSLRGWQDQIGYVPQSIFLTDDTLRRNVAFGLSDELIDDAAVSRAIKAAQLTLFVDGLPLGMNTLVGERGVRLSGGQRQRIGIARALYHDPAVLVLDEATSALDMATEAGVMAAINALHGDKTLLIIAHRMSTVVNCDCVYRMEEGRLEAAESVEGLRV